MKKGKKNKKKKLALNKPNKWKQSDKWKLIILGILWIATLFDIITFLLTNISQFETNPLFVVFKSTFLVLLFKVSVIVGVSWMLWKYVPKKTYFWSFILCFMLVYAILSQGFGAISNLKTKQSFVDSPNTTIPMEQKQAVITYAYAYIFNFYAVPLVFAILSFYIFEQIYLKL